MNEPRAESAVAARLPTRDEGGGAIPTSALHIRPIPWHVAKAFVREHHYLHSTPARRSGVFLKSWLTGELLHSCRDHETLLPAKRPEAQRQLGLAL